MAQSNIRHAGRGVFASKDLAEGAIIEICPIIEVPLTDSSNDDNKGLLTNYFFYFGKGLAMVLGFGSLYNHSYGPNATYIKNEADKTVVFQTIKPIAANEEITVNYNNGDPEGRETPMNKGVPPAD
jgi:SET domain-containing protein